MIMEVSQIVSGNCYCVISLLTWPTKQCCQVCCSCKKCAHTHIHIYSYTCALYSLIVLMCR